MRPASRNSGVALALAVAISFTVGGGLALAENTEKSNDEPTANDLKNSKERGIFLLPRTGSTNSDKPEVKISPAKATLVKQTAPARTVKKHQTPSKSASAASAAPEKSAVASTTVVQTASATTNADSIINVWLDKKGSAPQYKHGDKMKINVSATQDCNVMIFDFDGRGKLTQLYPNEFQQKTLLRAGDTITFGGADSPFDYQVSLPKGSTRAQERIFVYAYPVSEKPLSIALNTSDGSPFRSGEMTLAQYRKLVAESKVFFNSSPESGHASGERDVKIVPKATTSAPSLKLVSSDDSKSIASGQPNKKEVSFTILGN